MANQLGPVVDPARLAGLQPDIRGPDLVLRRWTPRDAEQLVATLADPEIQQWNLPSVDSVDDARKLIAGWRKGWKRHTSASWAVVRPDGRRLILGQVGFRTLYAVDGLAEVSYWVAPKGRGQGLASAAARLLSDWAFADLGMERLELVHSVLNWRSCRVALAAGFEVEGTKRHLQRHADGWHDMHLHARIRPSAVPVADSRPGPDRVPPRPREGPRLHHHPATRSATG